MSEIKFDQEKFDLQMKAFQNNHDKISGELEKLKSGGFNEIKAFEEKFNSLQDSVNSMATIAGVKMADYVCTLQKDLDAQEKEINDLKKAKGFRPETMVDIVKSFAHSDQVKEAVKSQRNAQFELKAANDLLTSDWTAAADTVGLPQYDIPGVTRNPWKANPVYSAVAKRTVGKDHELRYTEELTRSDAAAIKTEGSQYAQSGSTWIARKLEFYDVGHYTKHTRENMEDAEYLTEAINDLLFNGLLRAVEYKLVHGTASSDINGLYAAIAETFAKPLGYKSISNPSMADVLRIAKLFVAKGINATTATDTGKTGYMANIGLIGPASRANLELEKDAIGRTMLSGNERPAGLTLLESEDLTETDASQTFLVGDFSKAVLYMKRNLIIETGLDGNDFTYGMMTLRASWRGNLLVKNLEKKAFVKGDFGNLPAGISA